MTEGREGNGRFGQGNRANPSGRPRRGRSRFSAERNAFGPDSASSLPMEATVLDVRHGLTARRGLLYEFFSGLIEAPARKVASNLSLMARLMHRLAIEPQEITPRTILQSR